MSADHDPSQVLQTWLTDNPRAPGCWHDIARRVVHYREVTALWELPAPMRREPLTVLDAATMAFEQARDEIEQAPTTEVDHGLDAVARALANLREAVELSPLPRGVETLTVLSAAGLPDVHIRLGWRAALDDDTVNRFGYPLSLLQVIAACESMLASQRTERANAARAVRRQRAMPMQTSFVARMAMSLQRRFPAAYDDMPAAVLAHWCNAALDLADDPVDAAFVRRVLNRAPPPFNQVKT